jgi:hypothetical protein
VFSRKPSSAAPIKSLQVHTHAGGNFQILCVIGPVWIHGLELVLASWSLTGHKVSKHEG